jgi:hypothetical protein
MPRGRSASGIDLHPPPTRCEGRALVIADLERFASRRAHAAAADCGAVEELAVLGRSAFRTIQPRDGVGKYGEQFGSGPVEGKAHV